MHAFHSPPQWDSPTLCGSADRCRPTHKGHGKGDLAFIRDATEVLTVCRSVRSIDPYITEYGTCHAA